MSNFNALIVDELASKEETSKILNLVKSIDVWENAGSDFWNNRALNIRTINSEYSQEVADLIYDISLRIRAKIMEHYSLDAVYPDLLQVIRWFPGMSQPPHADDMTNISDHDTSSFHHRAFGAILYLNDDYSGGETFYPQHDVSISPVPGRLAVHPGTPDYMHGVTEIKDGVRYTIASFWTLDKEKKVAWPIYE